MTANELNRIRNEVRDNGPLVHCITNPISINQCANLVLAVGGRPIMAEHPAEVQEITGTAKALLLNLGNITDVRLESMRISAKEAGERNIPAVLDLVGIACSKLRRNFAHDLIEQYNPGVLKGNYSEINALYNCTYESSGVDADGSLDVNTISSVAVKLSRQYHCIILASGKTDIITDGQKLIHIHNGSPQLAAVTGTGCMLGTLTACYLAAANDITAVTAACAVLGICGQLAETGRGSGSFMVNLMDKLSTLSDGEVENYLQMEEKAVERI